MPRFVATIKTPMKQADAFAYMADIHNFAEWDPGVATVNQVNGEKPELGASYDVTISSGSTLRYTFTEYDEGVRFLIVGTNAIFKSIDEVRVVSDNSGGSLVTYDAELQLRSVLRVFDFALNSTFQRIGEKAAAGMEQALEGTLVST